MTNTDRVAIGILFVLISLTLVIMSVAMERHDDWMRDNVIKKCATEDSTGCVWDCRTMGNQLCGPVGNEK